MGPKSPGVPLELNNEALKILPFEIYLRTYPSGIWFEDGLYENDHHEFCIHVGNFCSIFQKQRLNRIEIGARSFLYLEI